MAVYEAEYEPVGDGEVGGDEEEDLVWEGGEWTG